MHIIIAAKQGEDMEISSFAPSVLTLFFMQITKNKEFLLFSVFIVFLFLFELGFIYSSTLN